MTKAKERVKAKARKARKEKMKERTKEKPMPIPGILFMPMDLSSRMILRLPKEFSKLTVYLL